MYNWREDIQKAAAEYLEESAKSSVSTADLINYIIREKKMFPEKYPSIKKIRLKGDCVVFGRKMGGSNDIVEKDISWNGFYTGAYKAIKEMGL